MSAMGKVLVGQGVGGSRYSEAGVTTIGSNNGGHLFGGY